MGTITKGDLLVIKMLALSVGSPVLLAANKETVIALLQEEGGISNPEDVVNNILAGPGPHDAAIDVVRRALWHLFYQKEQGN